MFDRIITYSVSNKLAVMLGVTALVALGVFSMLELPIDAVPDITDNQVQIITTSNALASQEVELLITMPIEQVMASVPNVKTMRSISRFGLSVVTVVFHDDVDVYWARAQINERMTEVRELVPANLGQTSLAPVSTGLGEIYQYTLAVDEAHRARYSLTELRTMQDWIVRRRLLGTQGVADVSSFGGYVKQIEVSVNPNTLQSVNLSVTDVFRAVHENNANDGGAYIEKGPNVAYIRTEGMVRGIADIESITVGTSQMGTPLLIRDVAQVKESHAIRYGAMTKDVDGETVGGIVLMVKGANSSATIDAVKKRIDEIQPTLPAGITIDPFLDRTKLVNRAITTVSTNLIEGALIVMLILVLLLGNLRAGLIVASVIPLSMLFAFSMMRVFGVSGNLMSLGAIDFGLIVDGAVIIVESVLHRLERYRGKNRQEVILESVLAIRSSASFGEIIILMVYIPILTLVGVEGKMFKPMAQTVMFAVGGAFILSLTYVPMMTSLFLGKGLGRTFNIADKLMMGLHALYSPVRRLAVRHSKIVLGIVCLALIASAVTLMQSGGEFIPTLDEGDFAVETRLVTGSSVSETVKTSLAAAAILKSKFPEVKSVIGKIGTSEIPTDPMPMESCDLMIILKDKSQWTSAISRDELAEKMEQALTELPGIEFGFQQPIQMRFNELMTGAKQDVVVKVFGHDLDELAAVGRQIGAIARSIEGTQGVYVEPLAGLPQIVIEPNRAACAQLGVNIAEVNRTVRTAFAGEHVGNYYEEEKRFSIVVRLDSSMRMDNADVERLFVSTSDGRQIPLSYVAEIKTVVGPNQVQREEGKRRLIVGFNTQGRDIESVVEELKSKIDERISLRDGNYISIGGQFENLVEAMDRLFIAVPAVLIIILLLLYVTVRSVREVLLVFSAIPLSAIGGIAALSIRDMPFSISAGIGFIALFGVAVLNGIVLISAFHKARQEYSSSLLRIVYFGTTQRLRPVVTTALVASLGFLPMALSTGSGAEVQRPLATVVIGGIISSTTLTLLVLPILYLMFSSLRTRRTKTSTGIGSNTALLICTFLLSAFSFAYPAMAQVEQPSSIIEPQFHSSSTAKPLAIQHAIDLARLNSASMVLSTSDLEIARIRKKGAVDLGKTNFSYMQGQISSEASDNMFNLSQTIPFPTTIVASSNVASAQIKVFESTMAVETRTIDTKVSEAYSAIQFALQQRALLDSFLLVYTRVAKAADLKLSVGSGTQLEKLTAQSKLAALQNHAKILNAAIVQAESELATLCGSDQLLTVSDSALQAIPLVSLSNIQPPILNLRQQQIDLADRRVSLSQSGYAPEITLGYFNQSFVGSDIVNGLPVSYTSQDRFHGFSIGVDLPLWFVPISAKNQEAEVAKATAVKLLQTETRTVNLRARALLNRATTLQSVLIDMQQNLVPLANTMVRYAQRSYEEGQIEYTETFNAYSSALDIRLAELQAIYDYNLAAISYNAVVRP